MAFPTQSILDTGTRANEDPLAGGWTGGGTLKILSNQIAASGSSGFYNATWATLTSGDNFEWFCQIPVVPAGNGSAVVLYVRNGGAVGYEIHLVNSFDTTVTISLHLGDGTQLDSHAGQDINTSRLGFSKTGTSFDLYIDNTSSTGWGASLGTTVDASFSGPWTLGLYALQTDTRLINVGGGPLVPPAVPSIASYMPQAPMIVLPQFRMVPSGTKSGHGIA